MHHSVAQHISLTPEHAAFIAGLVATGRYGGVSEVVRAALRTFEQEKARKAQVAARVASGRSCRS